MQCDEPTLVRRCLEGDRLAIRTLLERYQGPVYALCYRMVGHRQDAEDVTQEVLLRVVRGLKGWDRRRPLRPWIMAIAANRCRTYLAKRAVRAKPWERFDDLPDHRGNGRDSDLSAELELALAELRPSYRAVIVMFYEQDMSLEEIGTAIGRPIGTVKTWLHRARSELARRLASRGYSRPACRPVAQR